jgi:hypothetical protein
LTYGEQFTNIIANLQVFAATAEKSEKSGSEAGEQRGYSHMFAPPAILFDSRSYRASTVYATGEVRH